MLSSRGNSPSVEQLVQVKKPLTLEECMEQAKKHNLHNLAPMDACKMFKWLPRNMRGGVILGGLDARAKDVLCLLNNGDYGHHNYVQDLYDQVGRQIIFQDCVDKDRPLEESGRLSTETLEIYCGMVFSTSFADFVRSKGFDVRDKRLHIMLQHSYIAQFIELYIKRAVQPSRAIGRNLAFVLNGRHMHMNDDNPRCGKPFRWDDTVEEAYDTLVNELRYHHHVFFRR